MPNLKISIFMHNESCGRNAGLSSWNLIDSGNNNIAKFL